MPSVLNTGVAVIGTGHAGYTLAREYRRLARDRPLLVLSQDDGCSYSKPLLSNAFASKMLPAQLRAAEAVQMQDRLKAVVMAGETVLAIDPVRRELALSSGLGLRYEQLVLAVGATPAALALEGDAASTVVSVNDLRAYAQLRQQMEGARRITIIGAGLVGCEFANDFALGGYTVDLLDIGTQPLARLLPPLAAVAVGGALQAAGVHWHPGRGVAVVRRLPDDHRYRYQVLCSDGTELESDLVVSAVGLRPRTELAAAAGLAVNRGIVVDRQLRTSDPHIHALGDCAEVEGAVRPYIAPITHAARVLAAVLAGREAALRYPAMPIEVKTTSCPALLVLPPAGSPGQWRTDTADGMHTCALFTHPCGDLLGYAVTGRCTARSQELSQALAALPD